MSIIVKLSFINSILRDVEIAFDGEVKEVVNFCLLYFVHVAVLPLGILVLVHQEGSDALKEFGMVHEALRHTELHLEDVVDAHRSTSLDLLEDDGD
jgi:hypothetical protein